MGFFENISKHSHSFYFSLLELFTLFARRIADFFIILNHSSFALFFSELVDSARKAVISRVVELTDDRSALKLEVSSLQDTVSRLEGRVKEKEEETKRCRRLFSYFNFVC